MKRIFKLLSSRVVIVSALLAAQLAILITVPFMFGIKVSAVYYAVCLVLSIIITLKIINKPDHPSYKIAWIVPVLLIPFLGVTMYILFSGNKLPEKKRRQMNCIDTVTRRTLEPIAADEKDFGGNREAVLQSDYITTVSGCPPCTDTKAEFLPIGEAYHERLLCELEKAESYIFLEYFIIGEGKMWREILAILERKAALGVDVRIIYDDFGSIMVIPKNFERELSAKNIKTHCFERFRPVLDARLNNRDHRKIAAIDGKVAFTGGINIADEYINEKVRFGHWKDSGIVLCGSAAWNMTVLFLSMWDYLSGKLTADESYESFLPKFSDDNKAESVGIVQPYTDNPLDGETVGENIYLNIINRATEYVYIMTPYLIIDNQMETALSMAAKSGVDVRIMTPGIPDKFFVNECTKSFYGRLLKSGVRIFEYTPGFLHAKTFVADDEYATVGTVNLDFRSLYLHFECGAWMYGTDAVNEVKEDFLASETMCREITLEDCKTGIFRALLRAVLVMFVPLL